MAIKIPGRIALEEVLAAGELEHDADGLAKLEAMILVEDEPEARARAQASSRSGLYCDGRKIFNAARGAQGNLGSSRFL